MKVEYQLLGSKTAVKAFNNCHEAKALAESLGLKEAEYGDVYGRDFSYCYWNKSGDRNDDEEVIAYYRYDKYGRPVELDEEIFTDYLF